MLVLSRKTGESIKVGENIVITINRVVGSRVSVGVEAPREVRIVRGELAPPDAFESKFDCHPVGRFDDLPPVRAEGNEIPND